MVGLFLLSLFLIGVVGVAEITIGRDMSGRPVKVSRQSLVENHGIVVGATRCGKTTRFLAPLSAQLLQPYVGVDGQIHRDVVICFDLGGSNAWYWTWFDAARGRKKYTFSTEFEESDFFNFFQVAGGGKPNLLRLSAGISAALSISSSLAYGPLYFFLCCTVYLLTAQKILDRQGRPATARDVIDVMDPRKKNAPRLKDAEMIRLSLALLDCYPQLSLDPTGSPDSTINFDRILEEEGTCYFSTLLTGENSVRQIVGLAIFCLVQSAIARARAGRPRRNVYVCIDEFHACVGESFAEMLVMAAKFGIYFVAMAVQSLSQLKHKELDFAPILLGNANLQLFFTAYTKEEHDYISFQSRDVPKKYEGGAERNLAVERNFRILEAPAVDSNLIRDVSSTQGDALLIYRDGSGHKDPLRIHCPFYQGEDVHNELKNKPLPRRPVASAPAATPQAPVAVPDWALPPEDPGHVERIARMEAFMLEMVAEYGRK